MNINELATKAAEDLSKCYSIGRDNAAAIIAKHFEPTQKRIEELERVVKSDNAAMLAVLLHCQDNGVPIDSDVLCNRLDQLDELKRQVEELKDGKERLRKPISLAMCGVENTQQTQCNYVTTVICDDGTIWEQDDRHGDWRQLSNIPDAAMKGQDK